LTWFKSSFPEAQYSLSSPDPRELETEKHSDATPKNRMPNANSHRLKGCSKVFRLFRTAIENLGSLVLVFRIYLSQMIVAPSIVRRGKRKI
jgi:hypothetical protein